MEVLAKVLQKQSHDEEVQLYEDKRVRNKNLENLYVIYFGLFFSLVSTIWFQCLNPKQPRKNFWTKSLP